MFKAGDKVRIKSDLKTGEVYNGCYFVFPMESHKGETGIITSVLYDSYQSRRYRLDVDEQYYFSNDMLEPINDSDSTIHKVGDIVRIIDEVPTNLYGIDKHTWSKILGKLGKIVNMNPDHDSYSVFISEIQTSFWFPSKYFRKESTLTSKNSTENVSKLIECVPEIELSYCKKQIYTI